jgi:hypothetical protein
MFNKLYIFGIHCMQDDGRTVHICKLQIAHYVLYVGFKPYACKKIFYKNF